MMMLVRGLSRSVPILPVGQNLPAEAQGRQDHMASILALRGEGAVDPFIHFVRADAGAQVGPLRGRPVSSHHARGGGHVAGGHQELASSAAHGRSGCFGRKLFLTPTNKPSSYLRSSKHQNAKAGLKKRREATTNTVLLLCSHKISSTQDENEGETWRRRDTLGAPKSVKVDKNDHPN